MRRTIGAVARRHRAAQNLTQEELGEYLQVTTEFYARIERGMAMPSIRTFCRLVALLQVKADALLGLTDDPGPPALTGSAEPAASSAHRWKRLIRRLKQAKPSTRRMVTWVLDEMAQAEQAERARYRRRARNRARKRRGRR